jgi:deoxycytidylate deaminase
MPPKRPGAGAGPVSVRPQKAGSSVASTNRRGRELFFGLVAPLGVKTGAIETALRTALRDADYTLGPTIKISKWLEKPENISWLLPSVTVAADVSALSRKVNLMDAGDALRERWNAKNDQRNGGDAGAYVAISEILSWRTRLSEKGVLDESGVVPIPARAYLIDSLKHPDEVDRLRRTYGPAFISIGVYAPPDSRKDALESELHPDELSSLVDDLMKRDEKDVKLGQRVADAFFATDFIVDVTRDPKELKTSFCRLIRLLFGDLHITPEQDEYGMFLARAAQVRTGSLARQIGAAALRDDGTVASLGTNEVAKAITGGQYWPSDDGQKGRDKDYIIPGTEKVRDTSDWWRDKMLSNVIETLHASSYFGHLLDDLDEKGRFNRLVVDPETQVLGKSLIYQDIDYVRAVHAEAAAIIDAGRHGTSLHGTTMYATTFPCHECARHIVAAGIKEVVYLEPYPKSGVRIMFNDSISVDPITSDLTVPLNQRTKMIFRTFVGVAPARYLEFFTVGNRDRKERGEPVMVDIKITEPVLPYYTPSTEAISSAESKQTEAFLAFTQEQTNERSSSDAA